jgi:hypothetical protein
MSTTAQYAAMAFGAVVALIGIAVFTRGKIQGENRIRAFGFEAELSTPSLVVFVVGCLIFLSPFLLGHEQAGAEPTAPTEVAASPPELRLLDLECIQSQPARLGISHSSFEDEPIVVVNGVRLWMGKMSTGDRQALGDVRAPLDADGTATVELLEQDNRKSESLGKFTVNADRTPTPLHFTEGGAHYVLTYEIENDGGS